MVSDLSLSNLTWKEWRWLSLRALWITSIICAFCSAIYFLTLHLHGINSEPPTSTIVTNQVQTIRSDLNSLISTLSSDRIESAQMQHWFNEIAELVSQDKNYQFYLIDHVGKIRADRVPPGEVGLIHKMPDFWFSLSGESAGSIFTEDSVLVFRTISYSDQKPWFIVGFTVFDKSLAVHAIGEIVNSRLFLLLVFMTLIVSTLIARYQQIKKALHIKVSESESMYKVITENAIDWEEWLKPDGRHQYISPSCKKITGYSSAELFDNKELLSSLVHPEDRHAYRDHFSKHVSHTPHQQAELLEFRIISKDNNLRWIQHNCHPILSEEGESLGRYIVNRDITDVKLNQIRIRRSIELSYATLESSADHIAVLDKDGRILLVNNAWQTFAFDNDSTCAKKDWIGVDYLGICSSAVPPSDDGALDVYNGLRSVIDGEKSQFEYEYPCHSPIQERWFLLRAVPLQYHGGGVLVSHTDITAMKLAERELTLAASSFQASDPIVITDAQTRIIRVNEAFSRITGYTEDEVLGHTPAMLKSGKHDSGFYHKMWSDIIKLGFWEGEIWNRKKSGEIYPEHLKIRAVKNDLGERVNYIAAFSDITRQKQAEETIHKLAFYDTLTNLPNKSLFMERLEQTVSRAQRDKKYSAVLILDLNNFKLINESLGHHSGDQLLIEVAKRISRELRQPDSVARLTGDEFALLIIELSDSLNTASDMASSYSERLLNSIKQPYLIDKKEINLTACIGVDLFPINSGTAADIFTRADTAVHRAKESQTEVEFYQERMQSEVSRRLSLQNQLRRAVKDNQFILYCQDIVGAENAIHGSEVLIRWNHPQNGIMLPGAFIDVAESSGLIVDIGHWVLLSACQHIKQLQQKVSVKDKKTVAVNISARQFKKDNFVSIVKAALSSTHIDASWLELEITESTAMYDTESAIAKMNALKVYGIRWSIDDFGTGFSSLSYLKDLPFDTLKIDRSFVSNCHVNKSHQAIIRAIISMAHNLKLVVIAEGVECVEEENFLRSNQCDYFQGYLFSKPSPLFSSEER